MRAPEVVAVAAVAEHEVLLGQRAQQPQHGRLVHVQGGGQLVQVGRAGAQLDQDLQRLAHALTHRPRSRPRRPVRQNPSGPTADRRPLLGRGVEQRVAARAGRRRGRVGVHGEHRGRGQVAAAQAAGHRLAAQQPGEQPGRERVAGPDRLHDLDPQRRLGDHRAVRVDGQRPPVAVLDHQQPGPGQQPAQRGRLVGAEHPARLVRADQHQVGQPGQLDDQRRVAVRPHLLAPVHVERQQPAAIAPAGPSSARISAAHESDRAAVMPLVCTSRAAASRCGHRGQVAGSAGSIADAAEPARR